jgi:hypothetical protein
MSTLIVYANGESQEPTDYSLAYNDNRYVISSTQYTPTLRFRINILKYPYVAGDQPIATLVVYPSVGIYQGSPFENHAWFDVSRITQSQLTHDVSIPAANHQAFFQNGNSHFEYFMTILEEDIDPATDRYDRVGLTIFEHKSVWNGVRNLVDWIDFDYNDFIINGPSTTKRFLTDAPSIRNIDSAQSAWLYYIVNDKLSANKYLINAYDDVDGTGTLLSSGFVTAPYSIANNYDSQYWRIAIGPQDIANIDPALMTGSTPSAILFNAKSYTVHLLSSTNVQESEAVTFNLDQQCSKYEPVRLHWLNRLGGMDSFNFNLKSMNKTDVKDSCTITRRHHVDRQTLMCR